MCLHGQVIGTGTPLLRPFVTCGTFVFYMLSYVVLILLAHIFVCVARGRGAHTCWVSCRSGFVGKSTSKGNVQIPHAYTR